MPSSVGNNWHVFTGGPSSGKTTTLNALKKEGFHVEPEMARVRIDQEIAKGLTLKQIEPDSEKFEDIVLDMKLEQEKSLDPSEQILLDRGIPDTLAYYQLYNWPIPKKLRESSAKSNYRAVFIFELLEFKNDYARVENAESAKQLQRLFLKDYTDLGYDVIEVPAMSVNDRVEFIKEHLKS